MDKPAPVDHPIHELLARRWSPRAFDPRTVAPETLRSLLEAARWAPSAFNEQPWRFILARREDGQAFERMLGCLVEKNQQWAREAPVLMLSFARESFSRNDRPNAHAWHDVGLAVMSLTLEATARGLYLHQMAGIQRELIRERYAVPGEYEPVTALALGHGADPERLGREQLEQESAPRRRRQFSEICFEGEWGRSSELL